MHPTDESLIKAGRTFYGVCMAALGIQQLFGLAVCAYLASATLIVAGVAIAVGKKARAVALVLGGILLVVFGFFHVPYMIFVNPYSSHLGVWTDPLKALALAGGAFVVAGSFPDAKPNTGDGSLLLRLLATLIPVGGVFFSLTMIAFGIDHFLYTEIAAKLVPAWIPGHTFWTYFAGVALIGAGVGIITRIKLKVVGMLLGTMIFLWFVFLHVPRAIADPFIGKGNEVTSAFEALGFSGIAFVLACAFEALGFSGIAFVLAYGVRRREKVSSS